MDSRLVILVCLASVLLPSVQPGSSNKSRKVKYEYFDDYLLSITAEDAKARSHNRVPKPDSEPEQPRPSSDPALVSTSDDEDLVQASGDGGVKEDHPTSSPGRRHRPHRHPVDQDSEENTQGQERPRHHHLYIPESLPKEEKEKLEEEEQEEEDEEEILAEEERREEGVASEDDDDDDENSTRDLDILGYFKDVPREHWSCCMLGMLAGDKGFHCHAGFYAARITTRNPNRAHNQKMLWHGRDSVPTWGWDIMHTFQRCVARHAAEFHKCCFAATIEKRERSKWEHYRRQRHQVAKEQESQESDETQQQQQQPQQQRQQQRTGQQDKESRENRRPAKFNRRPAETGESRNQRRQEERESGQAMDNQQMRLEEQERRLRARRRRPHARRRQQS